MLGSRRKSRKANIGQERAAVEEGAGKVYSERSEDQTRIRTPSAEGETVECNRLWECVQPAWREGPMWVAMP